MRRGTLDWEIIDGGDWQAMAAGYTFNLRPDALHTGGNGKWQLDVKRKGSKKVQRFNLIRCRNAALREAERIVEQRTALR